MMGMKYALDTWLKLSRSRPLKGGRLAVGIVINRAQNMLDFTCSGDVSSEY